MARKPRLQFEGAIYHVTCRGNAKMDIFINDADRIRLKERLVESADDFQVRVYLYCFMPNHLHLLAETPQGNLSRFMSSMLTGYTVYFNRRHGRVGHLFQGRYGAKLVEGNEYLLKLSRYIHLNPVFVSGWKDRPLRERVLALREYIWSSYRGYAGIAPAEKWVQRNPLLHLLSQQKKYQKIAYRRYVETGLARTDDEFLQSMKASPWGVGTEAFLRRIQKKYGELDKRVKEEDIALRRVLRTVPPSIIFDVLSKFGIRINTLSIRCRNCNSRAIAAYLLIRQAGWTQRQVAEKFGLHSGSAVSHLIRLLKTKYGEDAQLRDNILRMEMSVKNCYFKG